MDLPSAARLPNGPETANIFIIPIARPKKTLPREKKRLLGASIGTGFRTAPPPACTMSLG